MTSTEPLKDAETLVAVGPVGAAVFATVAVVTAVTTGGSDERVAQSDNPMGLKVFGRNNGHGLQAYCQPSTGLGTITSGTGPTMTLGCTGRF